MEKRHAIIVIKDDLGRFLQYFDDNWNSYLFLNCKINDKDDFDLIKKEILRKYGLVIKKIEYSFDKIHSKFSVKDKCEKEYHHYFYKCDLISGDLTKFKYFSYDELLNDKRIQEVNSDIVSFIKGV